MTMSPTNLTLLILMLAVLVMNLVATKAPRIAAWLEDCRDDDAPGPDPLRHVY
jgi:hypothetical protein